MQQFLFNRSNQSIFSFKRLLLKKKKKIFQNKTGTKVSSPLRFFFFLSIFGACPEKDERNVWEERRGISSESKEDDYHSGQFVPENIAFRPARNPRDAHWFEALVDAVCFRHSIERSGKQYEYLPGKTWCSVLAGYLRQPCEQTTPSFVSSIVILTGFIFILWIWYLLKLDQLKIFTRLRKFASVFYILNLTSSSSFYSFLVFGIYCFSVWLFEALFNIFRATSSLIELWNELINTLTANCSKLRYLKKEILETLETCCTYSFNEEAEDREREKEQRFNIDLW